MKSDHVFATVMTTALFSALVYYVWKESPPSVDEVPASAPQQHLPERAPEVRPQRPAPPATTNGRSARPQRHQANGLYKCVVAGQTSYQDQPCVEGEAMEVAGTMSVVPRYPVAEQQSVPAIRQPLRSHDVALPTAPRTSQEAPACARLRDRIRTIDAQARQRSTQSLTDERRDVGKRMSELRCSFMD